MFFKVKTAEEVLDLIGDFPPVDEETLPLERACGRILQHPIISPEDLPGFSRTSMDGYALRAKDTFGATESLPALLEVVGEITMGMVPEQAVGPGQAVRISTGGMLPRDADGVVMIEYCRNLDEHTIEVSRAISPQENVIGPEDDIRKGSRVLQVGTILRPQDLGALAGLGILEVPAYRKPRVAIVSTGDEVIPADRRPRPGQVRDINTFTLSAFCERNGATPIPLGLCRDRFDDLRELIQRGLEEADTLWISGGSSVGTRDLTVKALESIDAVEILVHGISISPGKPTIIARAGERAVFGLPGHTASAMVIAEVFLKPFLDRLAGKPYPNDRPRKTVTARLSRNIESANGRDDYIRVRLNREGQGWSAEPIFGKSGLISTLVEADGLVKVDRNREGLYQDDQVVVLLF